MKRIRDILAVISLLVVACGVLHAQDDFEKINAHVGALVSIPLSPTSKYVHTGWGLIGGAGYNFSSHHSVVAEFMWNRLYATDSGIQPLRTTSQTRVDGQSNLYALTGNYEYQIPGKVFGAYFIGGGGLYYRITNLSKRINSGAGTACEPGWVWWGFSCVSGNVTSNQSVGSASSTAFGINAGGGLTARVGQSPYRLYLESRYHYAPNKNISTQLVTISFGIRY
jgi:Outer membrane protein beta-barrel domain